MKILVTGGLGYVGSHTVVELMREGHEAMIADNLVNAKVEVLEKIQCITGKEPVFYQIDVTEESKLQRLFSEHKLEGVLHFAGLKAVGESVDRPLDYYQNNILSTIALAKVCLKHRVDKFVFSSSATVYGDQPSPLTEDMELGKTVNPYGETKVMSERILTDVSKVNPTLAIASLRYFNPIGAHESGLIGERSVGTPNNVMPLINRVAKGEQEKLRVFGGDYNTIDGTGVRDYIHVVDVAKAHVKVIEKIKRGVQIYNLGTGRGTSVLELIQAFEKTNGISIPWEFTEKRAGDIAVSYANVDKAKLELGWKAERSIEDMVRDAWEFECQNPI
ncbi:UDP-galactose 4-epimerase [Tindallia magadiensis]|uniref:UDP-glucose 4-epimerase n=1 Tax=Tindallia magadiensis TaxID=69895 RepID=A0A1I3D4I2_9FIRM|nr:UDP-glucose 4-epimerase GalE [Tindallia magadiensis]SFH81653.1 UDP-galactose 4-epimerase [Tindallia magadiensis]